MEMFCFQCQETCRNTGCDKQGACGKTAQTAAIQDKLIQVVKAISVKRQLVDKDVISDDELGLFVVQSLFMTITNANFDEERLNAQIARGLQILQTLGGSIAELSNIPLGVMSCENEDVRSLRELITYGLKGIAAYVDHAAMLGKTDEKIYQFIIRALAHISRERTIDELIVLTLECGQTAVSAMALLDEANTGAYGKPEITKVNIGVGTRPGILVSGHDLRDIKELLDQTADAGVDVYTHSEMLAAHYYPELKKYPHLFGNYGNAWHKQNVEFESFNGPILMTTNCIVPVKDSYKDRIFTTGMAGWQGVKHIPDRVNDQPKDFSEIIALAKTCPPPTPIEQGEIIGGFAHDQVLALADKIVEAIKSGAIKRFVVMAGCDGRHASRKYFTEIAQNLPKDTVILTAGCAKYRYNKLDLGDIGGIPRVLDAGQCNDSYSWAVIALKLKEVFDLADVNDLPLYFDIGWYEQKAVAVLLALLSLGFKNVRLGPTLPAFLSPGVAKVLVENFNVMGITDVQTDLAMITK
ncbi:MAG: hydroxylamine reductase [Thermoguttaceae bacterium]|nr:hydroxylamine reductase [Thermoguttaceae bacterium]